MIIAAGRRHIGETTELVALKDPYYVKLVLDYRNPDGPMPSERRDFLRLIAQFDEMKLQSQCRNCYEPAGLLAFYKGTLFHESWCFKCAADWLKACDGSLDVFSDYLSALEYVDDYCGGDRFFCRMIIKNIAGLKGLPEEFGEEEAAAFFRQDEQQPHWLLHPQKWYFPELFWL